MMLSQQGQAPTLSVVAHGATLLKDVESFGKQDPYFRLSLDISNPKSFQKTFVHKNAGKNPVWNQSFNIPLNGEPDLYIEIMDEETTADAVIAFAAIPINQVVHAPGGSINGFFTVFTPDGKPNGDANITLSVQNVPGMNFAGAPYGGAPVRGTSQIIDAHQKRVKSIKNKEKASDVGMAVAGGLLAVGAGFLANKLNDDNKKKEEARRDEELRAERERQDFENEKKRLEEERANFERNQEEFNKSQQGGYNNSHSQNEQHHHHHHEESRHSHGSRDWDPVGTYGPGDKVSYHGRTYMCLQGHTSNPTWEPTQAHSLWRAD
ncbi:hypothetical protein BGZ76_008750 [Entomortierella beljakovae]|nr:hypothetical protein BGZ76_008750 [Entomortierella beljakovae]